MRRWFEVRVREKLNPNKFAKKSKFYLANSSKEAGQHYKGSGYVMSVEKVDREKALGIGSFFSLGTTLLKEFKEGGDNTVETKAERTKRYFKRRDFSRKETS